MATCNLRSILKLIMSHGSTQSYVDPELYEWLLEQTLE